MNNTVLELEKCLRREADLVQAFIVILDAEAQALTEAGATDALSQSTEEKNRYADQLTMVADERQMLLTQLGYEENKAGLDAAVNDHPGLDAIYQTLLENVQKASDLNTANGHIINVFLEHNQQALDTLRSLSGSGNLYDANGRTRPGHQGAGATTSFKAG